MSFLQTLKTSFKFKNNKNLSSKHMAACMYDLPVYGANYQDYYYALDGYCRNPVIYKCVRLIADHGSTLSLDSYHNNNLLYRNSKFLKFLDKPNNTQDKQAFLDEVIVRDRIYGNVFLLVTLQDNQVSSIKCIENKCITIETKPKAKYPVSYIYNITGEDSVRFRVDQVTGMASNRSNILLHLKTFHPNSQFTGLSPIESCAVAGDLYNHGMNL